MMPPVRIQDGAIFATRGGISGSMLDNSKTKISFFEGLVTQANNICSKIPLGGSDKATTACSFAHNSPDKNKISSGGLVGEVRALRQARMATGQVYMLYGVNTG
jgi:hypothetical protein